MSIVPVDLLQTILRGFTWRVVNTHFIYLTFDDGPHPEITPWVLDQLDGCDAKATFFLVGRSAEKYPKLVEDIRSQGHAIGNHTYSHPNGWRTSFAHYMADVNRCDEILQSKLFRPPYGKMTLRQTRALQKRFDIIMWDVMPGDYNPHVSQERLLARIKSRTRPGSIIVLHENEKAWGNLRVVLPRILDWFPLTGIVTQYRHPELVSGSNVISVTDAETSSA